MHSLLRRNAPQTGVAVFQTISVWGLTYLFLLKMEAEFLKVLCECETIYVFLQNLIEKLNTTSKFEGILEELPKRLNPFFNFLFFFFVVRENEENRCLERQTFMLYCTSLSESKWRSNQPDYLRLSMAVKAFSLLI